MPSWSPNWADVRFDHAAAAAAAAECRRVAALVVRAASDRARAADHARIEWSGPYRRDFDVAQADLAGRSDDLAQRLRRLAAAIEAAAEAARREQAAREAARAEWYRQLAAEQAAAAAAEREAARAGGPRAR